MTPMNTVALSINGLVLAGAGLLTVSLVSIRRLVAQLAPGSLRARWSLMGFLVVVFILGYTAYAIGFWNGYNSLFDMIVPAVFCLGAVFVWLVGSLALQTALDIKRIADLEAEAITDPLLGIYNRRHLERRLAEEIARSERYGLPLCLLLLDADRFKAVNDAHGHDTGDRVLKRMSSILLETVRQTDLVARYGGEEFAVLAPQTTLSAALNLAERLRAGIETRSANGGETDRLPAVTVSIGVAARDAGVSDRLALVQKADKALYAAKTAGRNRVASTAADARPRTGDVARQL